MGIHSWSKSSFECGKKPCHTDGTSCVTYCVSFRMMWYLWSVGMKIEGSIVRFMLKMISGFLPANQDHGVVGAKQMVWRNMLLSNIMPSAMYNCRNRHDPVVALVLTNTFVTHHLASLFWSLSVILLPSDRLMSLDAAVVVASILYAVKAIK